MTNNYVEFNAEVKHQIPETAIGAKFAPTYTLIFIDQIETNFLDTQQFKPLVWFRYINVFFIWTHGTEKLEEFLKDFSNYQPNIKFTHEFNKENITSLDLMVSLSGSQLSTDLHIKSTDKLALHICSSRPYQTSHCF